MNRNFLSLSIAAAVIGVALCPLAALAAPSQVYLTVREAKLRSKADFFSTPAGDIKYGDRLSVVNESGTWLLVKSPSGKQGYVHQSSITERQVVLKSSGKFDANQADQNDVVLAGKGFSAEVEREFAASHRNLNFADVNAMERIKVSANELSNFVQDGKLGPRFKRP